MLEVAFTAEIGKIECVICFKRNIPEKQFSLSILQLPNNYELKEMLIWQPNTLVLLLSSSKNNMEDRPHSILGLVDTSNMKAVPFEEKFSQTNVMNLLYQNSNVR